MLSSIFSPTHSPTKSKQDGRKWATKQINYMLGDAHGGVNPDTGLPFFSYVAGYGDNFPKVSDRRGGGGWLIGMNQEEKEEEDGMSV